MYARMMARHVNGFGNPMGMNAFDMGGVGGIGGFGAMGQGGRLRMNGGWPNVGGPQPATGDNGQEQAEEGGVEAVGDEAEGQGAEGGLY